MAIDLNVTPVAGGSSFRGQGKRPWEPPVGMLLGARNPFDRMPTTDDDTANRFIIENIIFKGMMTKKETREEKPRQDKIEHMKAFMEIQRRILELDAEKQIKKLEMEAEKQRNMLEMEATNAKTKAKEVTLAPMMMGGWRS
ncbi:putative serine/threonine-protein kinase [Hordeum vulgare]|nr:putative serine/threonine-protein kinase [Hordeum vulgare]